MKIIKLGTENQKDPLTKPKGKNWLTVELVMEATGQEPEKHYQGTVYLEPVQKTKK